MNEQQEKVLIHYIGQMLHIWGSKRAKDKFLYDFKKAGDSDIE